MFAIETPRLRLCPFTREEAEHVLAGSREGRNWSPGYPRDDDKDVARMFLRTPATEPLFTLLQIARRDSGVVIGAIGFFGPPDAQGVVSFGYGIAPECEGRGYTTEALRALLGEAFATGRVNRALADTAHDNFASQRVLEKAGLKRIHSDERLHYYAMER